MKNKSVSNDQLRRILKARFSFRNDHLFLIPILMSRPYVEDKKVPTMETHLREIRYNPEFVSRLDDEELRGVLAHEAIHVFLLHLAPHYWSEDIDRKVMEIACELSVNYFVTEELNLRLPDFAIVDNDMARGKSTFQIYRELLTNNPWKDPEFVLGCNCHENASGPDKEGNSDSSLQEALQDLLDTGIIAAKQYQAAMAGKEGSCGALLQFNDIPVKPLDWKKLLRNVIKQRIKGKTVYSYRRPSRRGLLTGEILKAPVQEPGVEEVFLCIDTSGSISKEDLSRFIGHIKVLLSQLKIRTVNVVGWDTSVTCHYKLEDFPSPKTLINKVELKGGGGTSPDCLASFFKEKSSPVIIIMTDGYICGGSKIAKLKPIWLTTGDKINFAGNVCITIS